MPSTSMSIMVLCRTKQSFLFQMNNENKQNQTHKIDSSLGRRVIDELLALKEEMAGRIEETIARIEQNYDRRLEDTILFLARSGDGENLEDSIGFNGEDSRFGHSLARQLQSETALTVKQAHTAFQMMQKYSATQLEPNGYSLPTAWEDISHQYRESKLEGDLPGSRAVLRQDEEHGTYIAVYTPGDGYFGEYFSVQHEEDAWYDGSGWEGFSFNLTGEVLGGALYGMRDGYAWYIDPDIEAFYYLWQAEQRSGVGSGRIAVSFSSAESATNNIVGPMDDIPLEMVYVPESEFLMGSPETELGRQENEGPQHKVKVSAFHMSKYPITQRQWRVVALLDPVDMPLELNPSCFKGDDLPVERVSWNAALEFCKRLSRQTGDCYRLPSEAEWEYACRATQDGISIPFYFGETISTEQANYNGQEAYGKGETGVNREQTTTVGSFPANAFGLHDMHGNVWEWCDDVWHDNYEGAPINGSVWAQGGEPGHRVLRGGDWLFSPKDCRSARRLHFSSGLDYILTGFRIVCSSESPETEVEQKESERPPLGELHVTALGEDGRFFHALRTSNGDWHGFNDGSGIPNADGNGRIAAAIVVEELHVCLLKRMHPPFFHAIRQPDGSWEGFNDCSRLPSGDGGSFMSCARVGAELHVCWVSGNSVFRAVRKADGNWNGFYDCSWLPNVDYPIDGLSCAGVGNELHVCMIKGRQLFHGVRKPDGSWEGFNDCSWLPNSDKILFSGLGCAGIGNELHICLCSIEGRFFHGIRKSDGSWEGFHDYSWIPNSNRIDSLSCVGIGNELHVCCIADQQFFHGIRKPDGSWEGFNDCSAIPNSSGFTDIVCAGF